MPVELAAVPGEDEALESTAQGENTARLADEAGQAMAQFGIDAFDAIGLGLVGHGGVQARMIDDRARGGEQVAAIEASLRRRVDHVLEHRFGARWLDRPSQDTPCRAIRR
jgi:hypothetical protein